MWTMGDLRWFGSGRKNKKNGRTYETGGGRDSAAVSCRVSDVLAGVMEMC